MSLVRVADRRTAVNVLRHEYLIFLVGRERLYQKNKNCQDDYVVVGFYFARYYKEDECLIQTKNCMIHFKNVSKLYPPDVIGLDHVNLRVEHGEFVSIVGQSGTGKSTLAKLLFAEERPTHGVIEIGGWDITKISNRDVPLLRRQIGVVFQDFKLLPKKTVYENIAFALQVAGIPSARVREVVPRVLAIVGLEDKVQRFPHQLSGGEQQRVAIGRALVHQPKILVADEPTGNLDTLNSRDILELLKKINEFGTTVVLVTHDREIVNRLKRRVITLEGGKIVSDVEEGRYKL